MPDPKLDLTTGKVHVGQAPVPADRLPPVLPAERRHVAQEYPSGVQITTDETVVLVQEYASVPVSASGKETASYPPPADYSTQLGRVTSLHSEPATASRRTSVFS